MLAEQKQILREKADELLQVYTSPRLLNPGESQRKAEFAEVFIDNERVTFVYFESGDQKRGVRIDVRLDYSILSTLAELVVTRHADQVSRLNRMKVEASH